MYVYVYVCCFTCIPRISSFLSRSLRAIPRCYPPISSCDLRVSTGCLGKKDACLTYPSLLPIKGDPRCLPPRERKDRRSRAASPSSLFSAGEFLRSRGAVQVLTDTPCIYSWVVTGETRRDPRAGFTQLGSARLGSASSAPRDRRAAFRDARLSFCRVPFFSLARLLRLSSPLLSLFLVEMPPREERLFGLCSARSHCLAELPLDVGERWQDLSLPKRD